MILTLDSSILIDLEKGIQQTKEKIRKLAIIHPDPAPISFMAYVELYTGMLEKKPKKFEKASMFLQQFPFLPLTKRTAEIMATFKKKYDERGISLSLADVLIASQVKEHNLLLVTKDKDFGKVEEINKIIIS